MEAPRIEINFSIEGDMLVLNESEVTENPKIFKVTKQPVITKEAFQECYKRWIMAEDIDNALGKRMMGSKEDE